MNFQIKPLQDTDILQLAGDLDIYSVEAAREALMDHFARKTGLELDLGGVETCDATGMQLLLAVRRSAEAGGRSFSIGVTAPAIGKCSELLGVKPEALQPNSP